MQASLEAVQGMDATCRGGGGRAVGCRRTSGLLLGRGRGQGGLQPGVDALLAGLSQRVHACGGAAAGAGPGQLVLARGTGSQAGSGAAAQEGQRM